MIIAAVQVGSGARIQPVFRLRRPQAGAGGSELVGWDRHMAERGHMPPRTPRRHPAAALSCHGNQGELPYSGLTSAISDQASPGRS
jgi:hypothetical protein